MLTIRLMNSLVEKRVHVMSNYIKREDVEQIMYSYGIGGTMFVDDFLKPSESEEARQKEVWEMVRKVLDRVAVKDVAPIRHGHWIEDQDRIVCSECGARFKDEIIYMQENKPGAPHRCLECGAIMDQEVEE